MDINNGEIVQQIDYDEFGKVAENSNPDFQPFAYAHGLYDTHTKLARFGVRDYEANCGRWTAKDPIGFGGGVSNLFEYCVNDPVNLFDPNGRQWLTSVLAGRGGFFFRGMGRLAPNQRPYLRPIPPETPAKFIEPKVIPEPPPIEPTWWGELYEKLGHALWEHFDMGFVAGAAPKDQCKRVTDDIPMDVFKYIDPETGKYYGPIIEM